MKISRKAEYALRALAAIAVAPPGSPCAICDIAADCDIPPKFLEQILLSLKRGGLVASKRGAGGGYLLQKRADEITILEVVDRLDGTPDLLPEGGTPHRGIGSAFEEMAADIQRQLRGWTVQGLIERERQEAGDVSFDI